MNEIISVIETMESNVFKYKPEKIMSLFPDLIQNLDRYIRNVSEDRIELLNNILSLVNNAIQNKDYVLLADVLRYELMLFIVNENNLGGIN